MRHRGRATVDVTRNIYKQRGGNPASLLLWLIYNFRDSTTFGTLHSRQTLAKPAPRER